MLGKPVRIGVDARSLLDAPPRGEGRSLLRLYQEIACIRPKWQFVFYGQKARATVLDGMPNARVCTFDIPGFRYNLWENVGLPLQAAWDQIDLLHSSSSGTPKWFGVPVVMTVHDVIPLIADEALDARTVNRFRIQLHYGLKRAAAIIAVSSHTKQDLLKISGIDPGKVEVIPWGCDPPSIREVGTPSRNGQAGHIRRPYMVTFGGEAKRKNAVGTLRAFLGFAVGDARFRLVLIGMPEGVVRERIRKEAAAAGLEDRVIFCGYLPDSEVDALLSGAYCLLYLSKYEGFGLPLLEAMASGVPIIASNRTSIPEVAGDAALLVDPDDVEAVRAAMRKITQDPKVRESLAIAGKERSKQFCWGRTAQATVSVFERVLSIG